jgi:general secretion pathway protein K
MKKAEHDNGLISHSWFDPIADNRGIAMLVALVVVVLLVTLIVEFDYGTRVALSRAGTFRDGVQAAYLAKSGVRAAQAILKYDAKSLSPYDATTELWATPLSSYAVGEGFVSGEITDESSKLNINLLQKTTDYEKWKPVWERLFQVLEIEPELIGAIKDWLDEDDIPEDLNGAEASYYENLDPPYTVKNGPIDSVGELRLIRGVTEEVYGKLAAGCGGKPCFTTAPTTQINVNTVSVEVCWALHPNLNEEACNELVEARPIESKDSDNHFPSSWTGTGGGTGSASGIRVELASLQGGYIAVKSDYFSILARGQVHETQRVVESLVRREGEEVELLRWRLE